MSTEERGAFHFLREHLNKVVEAKMNEQKASFWDRMQEQVRREAEDERIRIASATAIAEQILEDNILGQPVEPLWDLGTPALRLDPVRDRSGAVGPDGTYQGFWGALKEDSTWAAGPYVISGPEVSPYTIEAMPPSPNGRHRVGYIGRDGVLRTEEEADPFTYKPVGDPYSRGLKYIQEFLASAQDLMSALDEE